MVCLFPQENKPNMCIVKTITSAVLELALYYVIFLKYEVK